MMVTNVQLAKEVDEKKERNWLLEEALEEVKQKLDAVAEEARKREEEEDGKGKKVAEEDIILEPDPILQEEPFLKEIKALEGVPLFSGKMDIDAVMDWLEGMEYHFECEGISKEKKVKVAKSRLRYSTLTWWKY